MISLYKLFKNKSIYSYDYLHFNKFEECVNFLYTLSQCKDSVYFITCDINDIPESDGIKNIDFTYYMTIYFDVDKRKKTYNYFDYLFNYRDRQSITAALLIDSETVSISDKIKKLYDLVFK